MEEQDDKPAGAPDWIVTFADLMSLLLTFFVLLLSFSSTKITKFEAIAGSLKEALGMRSELDLSDRPERRELIESLENQRAQRDQPVPEGLDRELQKLLQELGGEGKGAAAYTADGIVLNISGDLMFASGEASLSPAATQILDRIASYVLKSERPLDVLGHTDDVPIATSHFPSNWELSAARAGSAVRYLTEKGVRADRIRAIGHASTKPVAGNATPGGRSSNRRVEFVFNLRGESEEPEEESDEE